jgi:hypothetical protein
VRRPFACSPARLTLPRSIGRSSLTFGSVRREGVGVEQQSVSHARSGFLASIDALSARKQRTVYRLTLVKGASLDVAAAAWTH